MRKRIFFLLALTAAIFVSQSLSVHAAGVMQSVDLGEAVWWAKRYLYAVLSSEFGREGINFLISNFEEIVLANPDPLQGAVKDKLTQFTLIVYPIYLFGIAASAFYLVFVSGSGGGRAKAKNVLRDMLLGLVLVSLSPYIMVSFLGVSQAATGYVLDMTDMGVIKSNLEMVVGKQIYADGEVSTSGLTCSLCIVHTALTYVEIELGYFSFLPFLLIVWGTLLILFMRYAAVVLWVVLFPLTVFLYSFGITKDVGRNMMEQFILWTLLQVFNAFVLLATAVAMNDKPDAFMEVSMGELSDMGGLIPVPLLFDMFPLVGCFLILLAPLFMLRLFRNFLP